MGYDLAKIKAIPIRQVAERLGISVLGDKARCWSAYHGHGDQHPSIQFSASHNRFKCWACADIGGSVIDMVMQHQGLTQGQAISWIADTFGIPREDGTFGSETSTRAPPVPEWRGEVVERVNTENYSHIYDWIVGHCIIGNEVNNFLASRAIRWQTGIRLGICWLPPSPILVDLVSKFGHENLRLSGVLSRKGKFVFDRHRIIFPFWKSTGYSRTAVFLQARTLEPEVKPKYMTLSAPIPSMWNDSALDELEHGSVVYLCEGIMDALSIIELGLGVAVAVLGTNNFRDEYVERLRPFDVKIIRQMDAAGEKFARQTAEKLRASQVRVTAHRLPGEHGDVNDYLRSIRNPR